MLTYNPNTKAFSEDCGCKAITQKTRRPPPPSPCHPDPCHPDPCHPDPCHPDPCICCCIGPQGPQGPAGRDGSDGRSAYQIALDNGFVGTEADWLESLKGGPGPFLSSYMEVLGNGQTVAKGANIIFDTGSADSVGDNITLDSDGETFTINRTGLYHVEWNLHLASVSPEGAYAVVGIIENGEAASGSAASVPGNFSSGTIIQVDTVPFTLSLYNFDNGIRLEHPVQWLDSAASIRIVRFADGPSV